MCPGFCGSAFKRIFRYLLRIFAPHIFTRLPYSSLKWGPPRRFYWTYPDWFLSQGERYGALLHEVIPPICFDNTLAMHIESNLPENLRNPCHISLEYEFVAIIPNGRVVGSEPAVITPDDSVLLDMSMFFAPYHQDLFFSYKLPSLIIVNGPVLVLACVTGSNYGHCLHQMLPRLHLANLAGWKPADFEMVIINDTPNNFGEEMLVAAGFTQDQLVKSNSLLHVEGSPLVVPSIPSAGNPAQWISLFLRETFANTEIKPSRRIYTSRANARWRKIVNEEELYPILFKYGFEIVCPEQLSFLDSVFIFQAAEVVCGLHGANLANISFCMPGSLVVEIYHPQHPEIYYWTTATGARLRYAFLLGEGPIRDYPDLSPFSIGNHSNTVVSPTKLEATFIACGLTPI